MTHEKVKVSIQDLCRIAIVTAIYVVITLLTPAISFGPIQFRIAEMLILLCFFNRKYSFGLILGCLIANAMSPLGWVDVVFGTLSTVIPCILICFSRNLFISSLYPSIFVSLIVGLELTFVYETPFWLNALEVLAGEFVVVTIIGYPVFFGLGHNKWFMQTIGSTRPLFISKKKETIEDTENTLTNKNDEDLK